MVLGQESIDAFGRDGFVVVPDLLDSGSCAALMARAEALVTTFEPGSVASIFSTTNQQQTTDRYFLESGGLVRFFFEEEAFDEAGALVVPKSRAINKIGHALHDLDPTFAAFSRDARFAAISGALGLVSPLLLQSMYIFKQPSIGGEVVWHQDATFLYTEPVSVIGLWFALEDATLENGCLWALPGGHRGALKERFLRGANDTTRFEPVGQVVWPEDGFVPLEVAAGSLIVLHGLLPHGSKANRSSHSRHAYALHVIDGKAKYPDDNWLKRPSDLPLMGFDAGT